MRRRIIPALLVALGASVAGAGVAEASSASLRGSRAAMVQQNQVAKSHGLAFYRSTAEIHAAVSRGELVELAGNADYDVADFVRHPYAHPTVLLFVERLAEQYRAACGQKLVVTSAVRPTNGQPSNAHALSVHPAGMAVDLRVSDRAQCRDWLEAALLGMERRGVLNGIREYHPPHYHVAIFPEQYAAYAAERAAAAPVVVAEAEPRVAPRAVEAGAVAAAGPALELQAALPPQPTSTLPLLATLALLVAFPVRRLVRRRA